MEKYDRGRDKVEVDKNNKQTKISHATMDKKKGKVLEAYTFIQKITHEDGIPNWHPRFKKMHHMFNWKSCADIQLFFMCRSM